MNRSIYIYIHTKCVSGGDAIGGIVGMLKSAHFSPTLLSDCERKKIWMVPPPFFTIQSFPIHYPLQQKKMNHFLSIPFISLSFLSIFSQPNKA